MCLSIVHRKTKQAKLDKLPDRMQGWKNVDKWKGKYETLHQCVRVIPGSVRVFKTNKITRWDASSYIGGSHVHLAIPKHIWGWWIKVYFDKTDIQTIGIDNGVSTVTISKGRFGKRVYADDEIEKELKGKK